MLIISKCIACYSGQLGEIFAGGSSIPLSLNTRLQSPQTSEHSVAIGTGCALAICCGGAARSCWSRSTPRELPPPIRIPFHARHYAILYCVAKSLRFKEFSFTMLGVCMLVAVKYAMIDKFTQRVTYLPCTSSHARASGTMQVLLRAKPFSPLYQRPRIIRLFPILIIVI